jgi:hypothetical protein
LNNVRAWVSTIHPNDPYDEADWHAMERRSGYDNRFVMPAGVAGRHVAEIQFRANLNDKDRRLRLTLVRPNAGEERP